jgi:hypothetical protein
MLGVPTAGREFSGTNFGGAIGERTPVWEPTARAKSLSPIRSLGRSLERRGDDVALIYKGASLMMM